MTRDLEKEVWLQVHLEEDGGGSIKHSWMKSGGLWLTLHYERQDIIQERIEKIGQNYTASLKIY